MPYSNSSNFGWLYYKEFYRQQDNGFSFEYLTIDQSDDAGKRRFKDGREANAPYFKKRSEDFLKLRFTGLPIATNGNMAIPCTTVYPGLLLGSGYAHQIGTENEFKLGFFFDHTTGLPIVPGSSVKGALRSWFPSFGKNKADQMERAEYIYRIWRQDWREEIPALSEKGIAVITALEKAIFDGVGADGKTLSVYKRDLFHDAVITGPTNGEIFEDDFITRHPHPLKNPNPVKFLKVRPGVTYEFRFALVDTQIGQRTISAHDKRRIFEHLLKNHGVGAKSNLGYGQFENDITLSAAADEPPKQKAEKSAADAPSPPPIMSEAPKQPVAVSKLRQNDTVTGKYIGIVHGKHSFALLDIADLNCPVEFSGKVGAEHEGKIFKLKINGMDGPKGKPTKIKVSLASANPIS